MRKNYIKKGLAVVIIILFIGMSITTSIGTTVVKKSNLPLSNGKILYVGGSGPGNYTKIQDAIDNSSNGDTVLVFNGTYHVRVTRFIGLIVNKSINLIGENKNNTIIDGDGCEEVVEVTVNNTNICRFTIRDGNKGILGRDITNLNLSFLIIQTHYGIYSYRYSWKSSFHTIKNCEFLCNSTAININGGNDIISGNIFIHHKNAYSIDMKSDDSIITDNTFISYASHNYYFQGRIRMDYCNRCTICNNHFISFNDSIAINLFWENDDIVICNNTISGFSIGILLKAEDRDNRIVSNHISNNEWGIIIWENSRNNKILSNNFINNTRPAIFSTYSFFNEWKGNYWGEPRKLPYIIHGKFGKYFPWINIDWNPASEPYDIPGSSNFVGCGIN